MPTLRQSLSKGPPRDQRVTQPRRTVGQDPAVPLAVPVATNWKEAVMRIVNQDQVRSQKLTEQRIRPIAGGAAPQLLEFIWLFYKRMDGRGIPVFAHTIVRDYKEQLKLFDDGFSKDSPDDGKWPHMAFAVDLIHSIYAWDMSTYEWAIFEEVGKELAIQRSIDIVWGGDWKFYDPAHWELRDWRERVSEAPYEVTKDERYSVRKNLQR